jgi:hypothetical protein
VRRRGRWRAVTFSPAWGAAPRPGPGAAEALGRKQSRRAPHLLIFAPFTTNGQAASGGLQALVALWLQPLQFQVTLGCTGTSRSWIRPGWCRCSRSLLAIR